MRRSVTIASVVAAVMLTAPMAALADDGRPSAATAAAPADCPHTRAGPGGGTGSGVPATGGDEKPPGEDPPVSGDDEAGGDKAGDDKAGGDRSGGDDRKTGDDRKSGEDQKSGGDASGDQASHGDTGGSGSGGKPSGGDTSEGGPAPAATAAPKPADQNPTDQPPADQKPADEKPAGEKPADEKPADEKPADEKPADEKPADRKPADDTPAEQPRNGDSGPVGKPAPEPADCGAPAAEPAGPAASGQAGAATSAAVMRNWGTPNRVDEFDKGLSAWSLYDGEGHAGNGRRSPEAASVKDGLLTINGDPEGTTAGMAWNPGQKYGRWEGRVKAPASDPSYNALLLLWPDEENFPVGGEVDFMEMSDHTRQKTEMFLHYGEDNSQVQGDVAVDATQWHNWAVEWTPDHITAFLDGKPWWTTKDTSILPPGPMHLCVQLDWFPKGGGDVKPSQMQVDWVRQYPLPESEQGDADGGSEGLEDRIEDRLGDLARRTEGAPDPGSTGAAQRGPSGVTGTP